MGEAKALLATLGTIWVHALVLVLVLLPGSSWILGPARLDPIAGARPRSNFGQHGRWLPAACDTDAPQLFLAAHLRMPRAGSGGGVKITAPRRCNANVMVDRAAVPRFPLAGPERPFPWLSEIGENPEICALIGADGRVRSASIIDGHGRDDDRLLRSFRGLRFSPALQDGRPVDAWHVAIVNRSKGYDAGPPAPPDLRALDGL